VRGREGDREGADEMDMTDMTDAYEVDGALGMSMMYR